MPSPPKTPPPLLSPPSVPDNAKKLKAFNDVTLSLSGLSQADKYAVLNAAAKFHNLSIKLDV